MVGKPKYDVFLSHRSEDKRAVEQLARRLEDDCDLRPFLDDWHLVAGKPWIEGLEQALAASETCAIFVGPGGIGGWVGEELGAALDRRVRDSSFRVLPVLLPNSRMPDRADLPPFLSRLTWVDLRQGLDDPNGFRRLVAGIRGVQPGRGETVQLAENPFRGLQAFEEEHAALFFGREADVQHAIEMLRKTRFLAVLGPSGSGKSSLLRAGILPELHRGGIPSSGEWKYALVRPGAHPLEELAVALIRTSVENRPSVVELVREFESDERALHLQARVFLPDNKPDARWCLLVDQFEEVFTLCDADAERQQFFKQLRYASTVPGGRAVVIVTMRADFLSRAAAYPHIAEMLSSRQYLIGPMGDDDLQRAIEEPARLAGGRLEPGLVDAILRDVGGEPGALPLMEDALTQLWDRRRSDGTLTLSTYFELGRVHGALAKKADAVFNGLEHGQQEIARRILLRLTYPGEGTEDTRRRARISEFVAHPEEREFVEQVVEVLTGARLLVTSSDDYVDVAHEALIRGWPQLREWIDARRAGLRIHARLTAAVREWERLNRDDGVLFRGALLAEALHWSEKEPHAVNPVEREFLTASAALRKRERESEQAYQEMKRRAAETSSQRLAAEADQSLANDRQSALALAARAYESADTCEARASLLRALGGLPQVRSLRCGHTGFLRTLSVDAEGAVLASGGEDGRIILRRADEGEPLLTPIAAHNGAVVGLAFAPDGGLLASASRDRSVKLWDPSTGEPAGEPLTGHSAGVLKVAFSVMDGLLASAGADGRVLLWDARERRMLKDIPAGQGTVWSVAFSPDGRLLASAGENGTVRIWDVAADALVSVVEGHSADVLSLAFSPSGALLASGGWKGDILLWDAAAERLAAPPLCVHESAVWSVAFSPDGLMLASAARDGTVGLWDTSKREPLAAARPHTEDAAAVVFRAAGCLISAGWEGNLIWWDARPHSWFERARHEASFHG